MMFKKTDEIRIVAERNGEKYIDVLRRWFGEEFLRCLERSTFFEKLVLRGGFLIWYLTDFESLPSNDLDFLYLTEDRICEKQILSMMKKIIACNKNEEIQFELNGISEFDALRHYKGYSVSVTANSRDLSASFKINIGLGDELFHQPELLEFDSIINEYTSPKVMAYPVESVISEKLELVLQRFGLDNCVKHLYDIYLLANTFDFDGFELQRAIGKTLEVRKNDSSEDALLSIREYAADEHQIGQWRHFSRINNIDLSFEEVVECVIKFIEPIWNSIKRNGRWQQNWSGLGRRWEDNIYLY